MASSGSFNTTGYSASDGSIYLVFSWTIQSQSIENNTTTISWELRGGGTSTQWFQTGAVKVNINGEQVYASPVGSFKLKSGDLVASGTRTFSHKDDGSGSFTASATGGIFYYTSANATGSAAFTLDTIARASQPSLVTWPESTANVGDFGEAFSIHMNRKSDSFTHTVRYEYGNRSGTIATKVTTGTTWAVPLAFMNDIPNATSGSGRIYVDTYNGSTLVGTKYTGFTATVPASVKPTVSVTLEDITGVDDIYGSPVVGLSKIKVSATATPSYSSPIASYSVTIDGKTYTSASVTTGLLQNEGDSVVTVTAKDTRGRTSTAWKYTMQVQGYTGPAVSRLTVKRCDADGSDNDQGKYIQVTFSATIDGMGGYNMAAYSLQYKKTSASSWTMKTFSDLVNTYNVTDKTFLFVADESSSYDVQINATDRHTTVTRSTSASTAFALMDWHPSGTGLRFGGVAEESNTLQNDLVLHQTANHYAFSTPGVASQAGYILMARLTHTKANADTPITFVFTQRLQPTPMTVHVQFRTDSTTVDPQLKGITYEGTNYGAFITKTEESVWDLYVQKVSAYDTVTLQDWYSSKTIMDRLTVEFPGTLATEVPEGMVGFYRATPAKLDSLLDHIYPVNSIYISYSHTSPAELFGGTWTRINNAFLWATTSGGTIGQTGGEQTHTLTVNEMPSHRHTIGGQSLSPSAPLHDTYFNSSITNTTANTWYAVTSYAGGHQAHNNMPPYIQVSIWRRTA